MLEGAGIAVLERARATPCGAGLGIGIVGAKGFVGGFPGSHLMERLLGLRVAGLQRSTAPVH